MMHRNDALAIMMTFILGFGIGVYLYFADFSTMFVKQSLPAMNETASFVLEGEVYGGCQEVGVCPSFHIEDDGSFRYLYTPAAGTEPIVRDGALPRVLRTEINRTFTDAALVAQSKEITPAMCESYVDGIDVRYEITIGEETYTLDTCGTDVDVDSALWQTLVKIWNYFETGEI